MTRVAAAALAALAATGCIGKAVVGQRPSGADVECATPSPPCGAAPADPDPVPDDAFDVPAYASCEGMEWRGDLPEGAARCSEIALDLPAGATVDLPSSLDRVHLFVTGGEGSTIRLRGSIVTELYVSLAGHAWLEIGGDSALTGLVLDASPTMEGRVLTIEDATVGDLAVRTRGRGEVRLDGARLSRGIVDVADLVDAESTWTEMHLRAERAVVARSTFDRVELEVGTATLVGPSLTQSRVARCGRLRLSGATLIDVTLARCDEPLILAGGTAALSRIFGAVEVSGTLIDQCVLAPGEDDELFFADAFVQSVAFCAATHVTASSGAIVCSRCEPEIADATVELTHVNTPECPSLEAAAALGGAP